MNLMRLPASSLELLVLLTKLFSWRHRNQSSTVCTLNVLLVYSMIHILGILKGGGHAKKVFLILVSNGQLNGEIMKYAFFKFFIL